MANDTNRTMRAASLKSRHTQTPGELQRYRLLVENVQDYAIFLLDPDGYVQTWNKGAERIKGYNSEEIIGKHFSEFYLMRDKVAKKPEHELELAKRLGRIEDEDWRVRKDGSKFWANVIITALHDDSGKLIGFGKVTRDLTVRKRFEDDLRQANTLLKQHQVDLERLSAAKDEFISLASHQLRTPATGIKQYLGMLLEGFLGDLTPEQLASVQRAYESNERQIATVNSLLKVAQLDAGRVKLKKKPTDVSEILRTIVNDYTEKFTTHDQQVQLDVPDTLEGNVDEAHYRMSLENLIDNASKYTPNGGHVHIAGHLANDQLIVTIKDTGVGIAPEDIPKLFNKFSRVPNALSDAAGGSGLGLYWADKIIALHGGTIEIESTQGKGTTFYVRVPME